MSAKHLPVYKAASVLVRQIYDTTKKAPRELRYTLVHRLISESVDLLVDVDSANRSESMTRFNFIREAQKSLAYGRWVWAAYWESNKSIRRQCSSG